MKGSSRVQRVVEASAIHPKSYGIAEAVLTLAGLAEYADSPLSARKSAFDALTTNRPIEKLAEQLNCGMPTLKDVLEQPARPSRGPRTNTPLPILHSDVLKVEDLVTGMQLRGTVRNVVDFSAFIDIGVKQDGLLHRTQIPTGTVLRVSDVIDVEILKIEIERSRIGLGWCNRN